MGMREHAAVLFTRVEENLKLDLPYSTYGRVCRLFKGRVCDIASDLWHGAGVALLPKLDWQRNKRNRPVIDEGNYDTYGDKENIFSIERFTQQRLGNESARQEKELAVDVFNAKGRHSQVASLRQSFAGFAPLDSDCSSKTARTHGIYDDRGLTLASSLASLTGNLSATSGYTLHFQFELPSFPCPTFCLFWCLIGDSRTHACELTHPYDCFGRSQKITGLHHVCTKQTHLFQECAFPTCHLAFERQGTIYWKGA